VPTTKQLSQAWAQLATLQSLAAWLVSARRQRVRRASLARQEQLVLRAQRVRLAQQAALQRQRVVVVVVRKEVLRAEPREAWEPLVRLVRKARSILFSVRPSSAGERFLLFLFWAQPFSSIG